MSTVGDNLEHVGDRGVVIPAARRGSSLRQAPPSRTTPDGTVEDRCGSCGEFKPRSAFVIGNLNCRQCRNARPASGVGALAPSDPNIELTPTEEPKTRPYEHYATAPSYRGPRPPSKSDFVLSFGKHKGRRLAEVPTGYLRWVLRNCRDVKAAPAIRNYLKHCKGGDA